MYQSKNAVKVSAKDPVLVEFLDQVYGYTEADQKVRGSHFKIYGEIIKKLASEWHMGRTKKQAGGKR